MSSFLLILNIAAISGFSLFFLILGVSSYVEKEHRAVVITCIFFIFNILFWLPFILRDETPFTRALNLFILTGLGLFGIISLLRFFPASPLARNMKTACQYDERDNMFARNNLRKYPDLMDQYFKMHPKRESIDRQIHKKPEFGDPKQFYHDPYASPCFLAAFEYMERTIPASDGKPAIEKSSIDPEKFSETIKEIVHFYGGTDTGIVALEPYHFYSHKGRHGHHWGDKTDQTHKTAIVIIIPMRVGMLKKAPTNCVIQESAQKYVEGAKISNVLAAYIRNFGYQARAHNDANYDTLCVPLAVDAGLGELGRMGIFMHRTHGPCVRLAVVTTELVLPPSTPFHDPSMAAFCKICKKCADNCPSGSIANGEEPESRGFHHWSIDQEKCFSYWKTIGSDCGFCIACCPYTKPNTLFHKLVRFYISRNSLNQQIALFMDDLLYGRQMKIPKTNPKQIFKS